MYSSNLAQGQLGLLFLTSATEKYCAIFRVNFGFNYILFDRIFLITVAASIFMPRPPAELELQTNFNAISKNVKILKIGPVEQKL